MNHTLLPIHHQLALQSLASAAHEARTAIPETPTTRQQQRDVIAAIDALTKQIRTEFPRLYWPTDEHGFTVGGPRTRHSRAHNCIN